MKKINMKKILILDEKQKKDFYASIPSKVYKTERNISIIVALTQACMMFIFSLKMEKIFESVRGIQYFSLYAFLFTSTLLALYLYGYTKKQSNTKLFLRVRRGYAVVLCIWVLCITYLETTGGKGITVYCYLMPTVGALLLLSPLEAIVIFGGMGAVLITLFLTSGNTQNLFSNVINSFFVTVLTMYVSYRYYRSMATEFCDRETISSQYKEIEASNALLQNLVHVDQLTRLFNRHYLIEKLYPLFASYQEKQFYGMFLMMDIDYFKQYNDSYGHIQGDVCLQKLADVLLQLCEKHGVEPIRFGGEEFLLIKMSSVYFDAVAFAKQIQKEIHETKLLRNDMEFDEVTVSIGLWEGKLLEVPHIEAGIKNADGALYEAKEQGRNCIVQAK